MNMSHTNETMSQELIIYQEPTNSYVIYIVIILIIIYLIILFIWLITVKLKEHMDNSISLLEDDSTQKINTLTQAYCILKEEMNCIISGIADELKEEIKSRKEEEVNISQVADELTRKLSQMLEEKINMRTQYSSNLKKDMTRVLDELKFMNQCYDNVKILISQDYKDLDEKINMRTQCTDKLKEDLTQVLEELEEKINIRTQCSDNLKGKISQVFFNLENKINMGTEAVELSISQVVEDLNVLKKKFSYKKVCKRRRNNFHRRNQIFKKVILPLKKENIFLQEEILALKKEVEAISYANCSFVVNYSHTDTVEIIKNDYGFGISHKFNSINSQKILLILEPLLDDLIKYINLFYKLKTIWFKVTRNGLVGNSLQNNTVNKIIIQHPTGDSFEAIKQFINLEELIIVCDSNDTYNFIPLFCENKIKKVTFIKFTQVSTPDLSPVVSFYTSKKAEVEIIELTEEPYKYICKHYYN